MLPDSYFGAEKDLIFVRQRQWPFALNESVVRQNWIFKTMILELIFMIFHHQQTTSYQCCITHGCLMRECRLSKWVIQKELVASRLHFWTTRYRQHSNSRRPQRRTASPESTRLRCSGRALLWADGTRPLHFLHNRQKSHFSRTLHMQRERD